MPLFHTLLLLLLPPSHCNQRCECVRVLPGAAEGTPLQLNLHLLWFHYREATEISASTHSAKHISSLDPPPHTVYGVSSQGFLVAPQSFAESVRVCQMELNDSISDTSKVKQPEYLLQYILNYWAASVFQLVGTYKLKPSG